MAQLGDAATAQATVWIEWDTSGDLNVTASNKVLKAAIRQTR